MVRQARGGQHQRQDNQSGFGNARHPGPRDDGGEHDQHLFDHRQVEAQRLREKERGHGFIEGNAVVVEVRADTGREAGRLRRDVHAMEALERHRNGREAAVAGHGGQDGVGPLAQVDLGRFLSHQPGEERIIDERVGCESCEHGDEEDPEHGKDADAGLAHDLRDDAEDGERHHQDDPFEYLHQPDIDPLDAAHEGIDQPGGLVLFAPDHPQGGAEHQREEDDADDVVARKRVRDGAGNIGGEVLDRALGSGLHIGQHGCGGLGSRHQLEQGIDAALPGQARLPGVHDGEADGHGDGDVHEADQQEFTALTQRNGGADERIEDREKDQRNGECLEQGDDEEPEFAQLRIAQTAPIGLLSEEGAQQPAADHGNEHLCVERQRDPAMRRLHVDL